MNGTNGWYNLHERLDAIESAMEEIKDGDFGNNRPNNPGNLVLVGQTFTVPGSSTVWRVLNHNGQGQSLIITEHVHGVGTMFNTVNIFRTFEGSFLQNAMNNWYANPNNVGQLIRDYAMSYEFQDNDGHSVPRQNIAQATVGNVISAGIEQDFNGENSDQIDSMLNVQRARTRARVGNGEVFVLSRSEAWHYFPTSDSRIALDVATMSPVFHWTRSPGRATESTGNVVGLVGENGVLGWQGAAHLGIVGYRSALWVDTELLFDNKVNLNHESLPKPPLMGSVWEDTTGFPWMIGAVDGEHIMLVSRDLIQFDRIGDINSNRFHNTNIWMPWSENGRTDGEGGPESRSRMRVWWNREDQVSETLRQNAVHARVPSRETGSVQDDEFVGNGYNDISFISSPINGSDATNGNPVFFLSEADIFIQMRLNEFGSASASVLPVGENTPTEPAWYWLRSKGMSESWPVGVVLPNGGFGGATANAGLTLTNNSITNPVAYRPAVWVKRNTGMFERGILPQQQNLERNPQNELSIESEVWEDNLQNSPGYGTSSEEE